MLRRRHLLLGSASLLGASGCLSTRGPVVAVKSKAPDFELKSHQGATVSLDGLLKNGPALVVFYRGFW